MKITRFSVAKLHGFLDLELSFNDDLTIIVGRNGSGKTSALSLISDLLRLEIAAVRRVPFQSAVLSLVHPELGEVSVSAQNTEGARTITLSIANEAASVPLDLPVELYAQGTRGTQTGIILQGIFEFSNAHAIRDLTKGLDLKQWLRLARMFGDAARLAFVKLDRTIVAVDPDGVERVERSEAPRGRGGKTPATDPIDEVLRVTTQKYGEYKNKVEEIKNEAFNQLLQLHFEEVQQVSPRTKTSQAQLKAKLQQLRRRVEKSALLADSPSLQQTAAAFFESFSALLFEQPAGSSVKKKAGRKSLQEESAQILLNLKERQLDKLLQIFEGEQEQAQRAYGPIKRYLDATSKFLRESGKSLEFDASLQLGFSVPSATNFDLAEGSRRRSLKELASGERQVIIVLTYLAFLSGERSIFIVDEPELSLHLRWQGYLVEALNRLRPVSCQIIVATHAPEIAGRAKSRIQLLRLPICRSMVSESPSCLTFLRIPRPELKFWTRFIKTM
jgi:predicted ATP-binding protein involved in virulence